MKKCVIQFSVLLLLYIPAIAQTKPSKSPSESGNKGSEEIRSTATNLKGTWTLQKITGHAGIKSVKHPNSKSDNPEWDFPSAISQALKAPITFVSSGSSSTLIVPASNLSKKQIGSMIPAAFVPNFGLLNVTNEAKVEVSKGNAPYDYKILISTSSPKGGIIYYQFDASVKGNSLTVHQGSADAKKSYASFKAAAKDKDAGDDYVSNNTEVNWNYTKNQSVLTTGDEKAVDPCKDVDKAFSVYEDFRKKADQMSDVAFEKRFGNFSFFSCNDYFRRLVTDYIVTRMDKILKHQKSEKSEEFYRSTYAMNDDEFEGKYGHQTLADPVLQKAVEDRLRNMHRSDRIRAAADRLLKFIADGILAVPLQVKEELEYTAAHSTWDHLAWGVNVGGGKGGPKFVPIDKINPDLLPFLVALIERTHNTQKNAFGFNSLFRVQNKGSEHAHGNAVDIFTFNNKRNGNGILPNNLDAAAIQKLRNILKDLADNWPSSYNGLVLLPRDAANAFQKNSIEFKASTTYRLEYTQDDKIITNHISMDGNDVTTETIDMRSELTERERSYLRNAGILIEIDSHGSGHIHVEGIYTGEDN